LPRGVENTILGVGITENFINMCKECKDCWHNYHCPMPQEGYDFDPDTCPYNPDNEGKELNNKL
jgi:hypothetical protein